MNARPRKSTAYEQMMTEREAALAALAQAKEQERKLLKSRKVRMRRADDRTLVVSCRSRFDDYCDALPRPPQKENNHRHK